MPTGFNYNYISSNCPVTSTVNKCQAHCPLAFFINYVLSKQVFCSILSWGKLVSGNELCRTDAADRDQAEKHRSNSLNLFWLNPFSHSVTPTIFTKHITNDLCNIYLSHTDPHVPTCWSMYWQNLISCSYQVKCM